MKKKLTFIRVVCILLVLLLALAPSTALAGYGEGPASPGTVDPNQEGSTYSHHKAEGGSCWRIGYSGHTPNLYCEPPPWCDFIMC